MRSTVVNERGWTAPLHDTLALLEAYQTALRSFRRDGLLGPYLATRRKLLPLFEGRYPALASAEYRLGMVDPAPAGQGR